MSTGISSGRFPFTLTIGVPGFKSWTIATSELAAQIADWRPFWPKFAMRWYAWVRDDFRAGGRFPAAKWPRLSPEYSSWKAKHFGGRGILWRTGRLATAARGEGAEGDRVFKPTPSALEIGVAVPYAAFHQFGTVHMPQRPIFYVDADRRMEMLKVLQEHVAQVARQQRAFARKGSAG